MRVYIAGPMSGHDDLNEPAFRAAAETLWSEGVAAWRPGRGDDCPCAAYEVTR